VRKFCSPAFLMCFLLLLSSVSSLAQGGNGSVGGTVQDASKGLIPGVTITLTNTGTGVTTTQISNESGVYNFAAVPAGSYSITATLPGFKTSVTNGVQVTLVPVRVNISLEVGTVESKVEVVSTADAVLTEAGASVGTVLTTQRVSDLPIVGQNVLSLLDVLPGFRAAAADSQSTIGGLNLDYTNTTINGLSTVSSRDAASLWGRQVLTTNVINPDLVGEIRLILSPVDAELGRGNSQIQIQTKSGTNKFNGTAAWNVQNTALNANTWANKRVNGTATQPDWYNLNQITGSYGGPIIRNKTFFFVLYDKQMVNRRQLVSTPVLTESARQGIWRYWEGWNPGPALLADPTSFVSGNTQPTGTAASVNFDGTPLAPRFNPDGTPYSMGGLRCFSVYGNVKVDGSAFTQADCPGGTAVINSTPWDPFRTSVDSTGFIRKILGQMPKPNFFAAFNNVTPDGLNTGIYRWVQSRKGPASQGATNAAIGVVSGPNDYNNRDQINIKIDHNISERHKVNFSWTWEKDSGDAQTATWGTGLNGLSARRPQFITVNSTSTLSSNLINEGRFGLNYSSEFAASPWTNLDHSDIRDEAQQYIMYGGTNPTNGKKYPVNYNPGANWNGYQSQNNFDFANFSPLYNFADTVRWTRGRHSFGFGGEYRRPSTVGYNGSAYINANPGNAYGNTTPLFFSNTNLTNGAAQLPNFLATTRGNAGTALSTFYGAIGIHTTGYWIDGQADLKAGKWQDVTTIKDRFKSADPYGHQTRGQIQNEWSFFAKDDFKLNSRLTLNIGIRYDYAGSPYLTEGLTNRLVDEGYGLFGASRTSGDPFANWLTPGNLYLSGYGSTASNPLACAVGVANPAGIPASNCDPSKMSSVIFVGPGTDHPDLTLVPQKGAFSPALGLSWQVPWFGDKTTIRGGFQRTYGKPGAPYTGGLLSGPGADAASSNNVYTVPFAGRAANLTDLPLAVPAPPARPKPQDLVYRVGSRSNALSTYALFDPAFKSPYADNWTLTITRSLSRALTLEVRAVNTLARNQSGSGGAFGTPGTFDINTVNVYNNPELFKALEVTRAGGNDPLFDQMLMGLNLNTAQTGYAAVGTTPAGGVLQRGSAHIRRAFSANLANGNYVGVINGILGLANTTSGLQAFPTDPATGLPLVTGQHALRNGCNRLANGATLPGGSAGFVDPATGQTITPRCFPENYFIANPQWSTALYSTNLGHSNYNSVEAQVTMRPTHGLSFQGTYGFSKTMVQPGNGFTNPLNPKLDYGVSGNSVGHDVRMNGTFELPVGPNKLLFPNSSGVVARLIERWQLGFIYNISSGALRTFGSGNNMLYANGRPNIVGPWDNPRGSVRWEGQNGQFFEDTYATYTDPQCEAVQSNDPGNFNLNANCTLRGLAKVVPQGTPGAIVVNPATNTFGIKLLENPRPGQQGNLGANTMQSFPKWRLDGNLSKTFQVRESVQAQLRIDATNVLNHPTPTTVGNQGDFVLGFSDIFGQMNNKTGSRTFQARLRLTF
jgi:hypothetical protein